MKNILLIICVGILAACNSQIVPLTEKEKALQAELIKDCNCRVLFRHDYTLVMADSLKYKESGLTYPPYSDSVFFIACTFINTPLKYDWYMSCDSVKLKEYSENVIRKLIPVMSYKEKYRRVIIYYSTVDKGGEAYNCSKELVFRMKDTIDFPKVKLKYNQDTLNSETNYLNRGSIAGLANMR